MKFREPMLNICLLFHSAKNDNLGVGALSVSEATIIRRIAAERDIDVHITLIDSRDPRPAYLNGPDVTSLSLRPLRRPWQVFAAFRAADLVIDIGGGDSFTDIYGNRRFARMMFQKMMVPLAGKPMVLAPQTIGPFRSTLRQNLALASIRRASLVATRDKLSSAALANMGFDGPVIEASDVALRLPYDPPTPRASGKPPRVGLNVSGLLMAGGYTRNNMFGLKVDYPSLVRRIISTFREMSESPELHLVPHVITWGGGGVEDDLAASRTLATEFPGTVSSPAFTSPSEAKSYIASLDFFIGARMHACIAALSTGVPVIPMAYSRKFAGMFGSLGYDHTVDCTTEDAETIIARILSAYDDRATLAKETNEALKKGLQRLARYESALGDLMERIASPRR